MSTMPQLIRQFSAKKQLKRTSLPRPPTPYGEEDERYEIGKKKEDDGSDEEDQNSMGDETDMDDEGEETYGRDVGEEIYGSDVGEEVYESDVGEEPHGSEMGEVTYDRMRKLLLERLLSKDVWNFLFRNPSGGYSIV